MHEMKAYQCDYCDKHYKHKGSAKRHEDKCFNNPKRKACLSCKHFKTDYETIYVRPHGDQNCGDADYDVPYNYCNYDLNNIVSKHDLEDHSHKHFQFNCKHWEDKQ